MVRLQRGEASRRRVRVPLLELDDRLIAGGGCSCSRLAGDNATDGLHRMPDSAVGCLAIAACGGSGFCGFFGFVMRIAVASFFAFELLFYKYFVAAPAIPFLIRMRIFVPV